MREYPKQASPCYRSGQWICLRFQTKRAIRGLFGQSPGMEQTSRGLLPKSNAFQSLEKPGENFRITVSYLVALDIGSNQKRLTRL